jgi:ubiquitin carboxyl-terminal hydrolase 12/46
MGSSSSKLERVLNEFPEGERYFGLENFGNTCYCNSVLQALYFCRTFRDKVMQYTPYRENEDNLLVCLTDLFSQVNPAQQHTHSLFPSPRPQCQACLPAPLAVLGQAVASSNT